ncbi:MAG: (Fe-S)-binding protein [Candidatus Freyarchaeota archaeon]|nr:(Fe-S)-binding protein [Candidatus Jordarchaeia archaeon]
MDKRRVWGVKACFSKSTFQIFTRVIGLGAAIAAPEKGGGQCVEGCPFFKELRLEPYSSRGKMIIARGLAEGVVKPSRELLNAVAACTTCGYCMYKCALQNVDVIIALRAELVRLGYTDPEHERAAKMIANFGNPYSKSLRRFLRLPRGGETLFFAGCSYAQYLPEKLDKIGEVLSRVGGVGWFGPDEPCCGNLLLASGQIDAFVTYGEQVLGKFKEAGVKRIVTACPGCHETFSKEYPKFFDFELEVEHLTRFLAGSVDEGRLLPRGLNARVAFHDPCHLARFSRIIDEPRFIIENVAGVVMVELKHNKLNTICCGGGGGAPIVHPRLTAKIADRRISEAIEADVEFLVTSCPLCEHMLSRSAKRMKTPIQILDIAELF